MAFTYDVATPVGRTRLMIPDRKAPDHIFEDEEIQAFLAMEDDQPKLATALALETIASDEVLVLKVMSLLDLSTDGSRVSAELRARAQALREDFRELDEFDWAEMVVTDASRRETIWNRWLRAV